MKKIINGKVYDTETARNLGFWANIGDRRNFSQMQETLYQKRTGEFFLYGEGGPMTKYAVSIDDNNWSGGEKIIPLSPAKAREWAEEHLDGDEYEAIFGVPEDDGGERATLCVNISASVLTAARRAASDRGATLTAIVEQALAQYLDR